MSAALFSTTLVEIIKVGKQHPKHHLQLTTVLTTNTYFDPDKIPDITNHLVGFLLTTLSDPKNIPAPPTPLTGATTVPEPVKLSLTGLSNLIQRQRLTSVQKIQLGRLLTMLIEKRPEKVMTLYERGGPKPTEIADHYKKALQKTLSSL
jgi:F420-0:gamma-glutamyl ligase-like protein